MSALPALATTAAVIAVWRTVRHFWRIEHAQDDIEDET